MVARDQATAMVLCLCPGPGWNGVTECFVFAAMSQAQVDR